MGVGLLGVEALEELLVDGVEEVLLFGVAGLLGLGGLFDGGVEAVEGLEELVAGEVAGGDGADDLLDLGGDDVAGEEFLIVEDLAEDALGEEMLDEHLADGVVGEVGIDGLAAEFGEGLEVLAEGGILLVLGFEDGGDAASEVGDLVGELGDGLFPVGDVGVAVVEEKVEDFDQVLGPGDVAVEGDAVVLIEDGAVGGLEEDVGQRVSCGYFGFDFLLQVVGGVLRFPKAVGKSEGIDECSVGAEGLLAGAFELVLLYEMPAVRARRTS